MSKVFISYRRKESADFSGRLFDRLCGYFGSERVYMDVDDLIAGRDYREQIGEIIADCSVVLAVIGKDWLTIEDDNGRRRLDEPDDQLRVEIETAFQQNKQVVPVLIHAAELPAPEDLPESIGRLGTLSPARIQSGVPFQGDVRTLLDRLERYGVKHPDKRFPLELILIPLGIFSICCGSLGMAEFPYISQYITTDLPVMNQSFFGDDVSTPEPAPYLAQLQTWFIWCIVPLLAGPLLIVAGKRWCCLTKKATASRTHFQRGGGRLATPKNSKAVYSLASGLTFPSLGILSFFLATFFAIWATVELKKQKSWVQGRALACMGVIISLLGIGTTYFVHIPLIQEVRWHLAYEKASQERLQGLLDIALVDFGKAEELGKGAPLLETTAKLFQASTLAEHEQLDASKKAYNDLVDESASAEVSTNTVLRSVYEQAIEDLSAIYDSEGDFENAERVRRAKSFIGGTSTSFEGDYGNTTFPSGGSDIEYDDSAPPPPAPVPDPSASENEAAPIPPPPMVDPDA